MMCSSERSVVRYKAGRLHVRSSTVRQRRSPVPVSWLRPEQIATGGDRPDAVVGCKLEELDHVRHRRLDAAAGGLPTVAAVRRDVNASLSADVWRRAGQQQVLVGRRDDSGARVVGQQLLPGLATVPRAADAAQPGRILIPLLVLQPGVAQRCVEQVSIVRMAADVVDVVVGTDARCKTRWLRRHHC